MTCIFCEIVKGSMPSHNIWEDSHHLAFLSIYPNTDGFSVVIPKSHYSSYAFTNSNDILCSLIIATKKVARLLDAAFDDVARTGMMFEGYGVDHLHSKLFPMHGTGKSTNFQAIESPKDKFFNHYEGYLSSHDSHRADDDKLTKIAQNIRKHNCVIKN